MKMANIRMSSLVSAGQERNDKYTDASQEGEEHKRSISLGPNATAMHPVLVGAPLGVPIFIAAPADDGVIPSGPISRSIVAVDTLKCYRESLTYCKRYVLQI